MYHDSHYLFLCISHFTKILVIWRSKFLQKSIDYKLNSRYHFIVNMYDFTVTLSYLVIYSLLKKTILWKLSVVSCQLFNETYCFDGIECFSLTKFCDGENDCSDESDELFCRKFDSLIGHHINLPYSQFESLRVSNVISALQGSENNIFNPI